MALKLRSVRPLTGPATMFAAALGTLFVLPNPLRDALFAELSTIAAASVPASHGSPAELPCQPADAPSAEYLTDSLALVLAPDSAAIAGDAVDARIAAEQEAIRSQGATGDDLEKLGWSFVEKARVSGDHGYYLLAGEAARAIRAIDAESSAADLLEGHALQSLHRFADAEQVARRLTARRGSPLDHALLGDTLLDQGRIDEAVSAYEKMMEQRPDSRAYSRVAEVRLLTGDLEGALDAMRVAARAVSVRDREAFAWVWSRLALFEMQSGHIAEARTASEAAASASPGSPVAELVRGRVLLASGNNAEAIAALERSIAGSPLPDAMRALADAYTAAGRSDDAARITAELQAGGASIDARGYSLFLAETGRETARALQLASAELENRRDVYTYDALAMASVAAGRTEDARRNMKEALAAGSADPRLWYHAGIVASADHEPEEARDWFTKARSAEQMLLPSLRRDLAARLDELSSRVGVATLDDAHPASPPSHVAGNDRLVARRDRLVARRASMS